LTTPEIESKAQIEKTTQVNRVFVVLNPVAGLTDPVEARQTITQYFEGQGWQCEIHETKKDENLRKLVRDQQKQGADIIIAAGGDGTVSAVVSGMVNSKIPMGILPGGTGNALARDLAIPVDLPAALKLLGDAHAVREMDIMEVKDAEKKDFYVMNVSVGVTSQVMRKTGREEKRRFGFLAYIYNAIGTILHSDRHHFEVKVDDRAYRVGATEVMIANCKFMGLQPQIDGVEIDPNDGHLDMFIVRARSLRGYLEVFTRFALRRKPNEDTNLRYLKVRNSLEIKSEVPLPVQADGEVIGKTPVSVRLIPSALKIIAPAPGE
jgi:YegS/Rv2252/BmrU family lipid kinase